MDRCLFRVIVNVRVGLVEEPVKALDVFWRPGAGAVEVVELEECGRVEALDMVLLYMLRSAGLLPQYFLQENQPAMCLVAQFELGSIAIC